MIQVKVDECNVQLNEIKNQMKTAKGQRMNMLKQKALQILRRRKMYDTQLSQVMNQQFNVDQVAFTNESIQDTLNTVQALKAANVAQKEQMKNFDMDQMEDLFDDMADLMADHEEIQEVMGRTYDVNYDESELLGELDELDEEIVSEQLGAGLGMPSYIPNSQKQEQKANVVDEEAALHNLMSN